MQVWIDYNGGEMLVNEKLAPLSHPKLSKSLLYKHINLSSGLLESMYVGFSASTGLISNSHCLIGWSWNQSGQSQGLDPAKLPPLPRFGNGRYRLHSAFLVLLILMVFLLLIVAGAAWSMWKKKYEELYKA